MRAGSTALLFYGFMPEHSSRWIVTDWGDENDEMPQQELAHDLKVTWQEFYSGDTKHVCIASFCKAAHNDAKLQLESLPAITPEAIENMKKYAEAIGIDLKDQMPQWYMVTWIN